MIDVLLVDPSEPVRERLRQLLNDIEGIHVRGECETAEIALQAIQVRAPDVVIIDIRLHNGDGLSLLNTIKRTAPNILIIVFSQLESSAYRMRLLSASADYCFDKPNEAAALTATLRRLAKGDNK
jgi:DNA-binding NarL/FixJ family response regulator